MEPIKYFCSYSRKNSEFVIRLATDLKNAQANVWLDQTDIPPGSRWDDSVQNALNGSRGILVVLSTDSVKSENVLDEVAYAISKGKRIVPLMIESCSIPFRLARFQHIDFTGDYDIALKHLLKTLNEEQSSSQEAASLLNTSSINKSQSKEKAPSKEINSLPATKHRNQLKLPLITNLSKPIGILFIVLALVMTMFNKCPTNVQYFIIYALIGIGIALLLFKTAEGSAGNVTVHNMGITIGAVALPFILFFTNPIGSFKPDDCRLQLGATSTTVFVHGKKSKQDMILRQKGFVIMDLGGERKKASINENGQAFFQNLHIGDSVRLDIDFSEPYKTIYADSVYVIQVNSNIYLPVALQGIDKVKGMVLYNDAPLSDVTVKLKGATSDLLDTTSQTGDFSFTIPEQMQTKEYEVWFIKKGFKTRSAPAFPQTGELLNIVMEKR